MFLLLRREKSLNRYDGEIFVGMAILTILGGEALNITRALEVSTARLVCRVVGKWRVIVDDAQFPLKVQIQRRFRRHWMTDDGGGGVRYINGVVRESTGAYSCGCAGPGCLPRIREGLPPAYQTLLLLESDDWEPMEREVEVPVP